MKVSTPAFSIVIPTRNRSDLLGRAMRSVEAQTFRDFETIVVDDGSTDDTQRNLTIGANERRRFVRNETARGVSAARNRGVRQARGDIIVFLDDDDELRPQALALIKETSDRCQEADFFWGARLIHQKDVSGREVGQQCDDFSALPQMLTGTAFLPLVLEIATNSAFAIRRGVFHELGGFDEQLRVSEDRDLFLTLAERGHVGAPVPEVIIDVDQHFTASLSRNQGVQQAPDFDMRVLMKHRVYLEQSEHRHFMNSYILAIYSGYLEAGNRVAAARVLNRLRGLPTRQVLRKYVRHAPEFRALKSLVRYDTIRYLRNRRKTAGAALEARDA